jgi:hypothetical protein
VLIGSQKWPKRCWLIVMNMPIDEIAFAWETHQRIMVHDNRVIIINDLELLVDAFKVNMGIKVPHPFLIMVSND